MDTHGIDFCDCEQPGESEFSIIADRRIRSEQIIETGTHYSNVLAAAAAAAAEKTIRVERSGQ